MNVFEAVKQSVTTRQAAEHYGMMPKKISGISMVRKSAISGMFSLLMVKASPAENSEAK